MTDATPGVRLIEAERRRQIDAEGYTPEHDRQHGADVLARAAACYAAPPQTRAWAVIVTRLWPWRQLDWKPTPSDRHRELVKAGALIAAALDALERD